MTVEGGDGDYTNGEIYKKSLVIPYNGDGILEYKFLANDGADDATGTPASDRTLTVLNSAVVRPSGSILNYDYTSIDAAVDDTANNGKYIVVYPNDDFTAYSYGEKVTANSSSADGVTLMSACGADLTIIDNTVDNGTTIFIQDVSDYIVDGFSITGASSGRGIDINRIDSTDFTVRNSRIYGNAYGIYFSNAQNRPIYIDNTEVYSNTTTGMYLPNSQANDIRITGCEFHSNNVGASSGAAMYLNTGSAATISRSVFRDNTTTGQGGAIYTNLGNLTIENSIFADNQAQYGGVIRTNSGPTVTITNSTFADNSATSRGGVIYICATGTTTVHNSIFWGNTASSSGDIAYKDCSGFFNEFMTITDSDVSTSGSNFGNGTPAVIDNKTPAEDPLFVNATADNYHIQSGSPVIDQANAAYAPEDDIDGDSRPQDSGDDMGADEYMP